jgi:glycosyltransferase involved in cell wall biosynthesis
LLFACTWTPPRTTNGDLREKPMRIAFLGTKGIPGHHGVEVVVDSLASELAALGHEITVYGYDTYTVPNNSYRGVRVRTVQGSSHNYFEMISHMWNAASDTRRETYDLVHIHSTDPCLLAWLPRARWGVVATSHGQAYKLKKWNPIARWISKLAERFFIHLPKNLTTVSLPLADYYRAKYQREVRYIPNGVRVMEQPDASHLRKWGLEPEGYLFCAAGRFERTKGIHTLLEAYARLGTSLPLILAGGGNGSDVGYVNELLHAKPAGVKCVGFLTGDSLFALYAYARAFVFPSENEAMSMAFLEGLSFGTPTVYSNIPANETVAHGLGYSFAVADAGALAETLEYVMSNYREAREKGRQAQSYIQKKHDWTTIAAQYNDLYSTVVGV